MIRVQAQRTRNKFVSISFLELQTCFTVITNSFMLITRFVKLLSRD